MACSLLKSYRFLSSWNPSKSGREMPKVQVVTVFLQKGNKVLVLQRAKKDAQHRLWGIPGGKIEKNETPLMGLVREIYEETKVVISADSLHLLGTALSQTPCDGVYGLYMYHAVIPDGANVQLNNDEHYALQWVTLDEFKTLDLLTAQGEAFQCVQEELEECVALNQKNQRVYVK